MRVVNETVVNAGDMSANITQVIYPELSYMVNLAVQSVYTGAPTGTLQLYASNDKTTWSTLGNAFSASISASGDTLWNLANIGYPYARVVYTYTSGTGNLTVKFFAKGA